MNIEMFNNSVFKIYKYINIEVLNNYVFEKLINLCHQEINILNS